MYANVDTPYTPDSRLLQEHEHPDQYQDYREDERSVQYPVNAGSLEHAYGGLNGSQLPTAVIVDPNSPYYGMDSRLAGFMHKHNVVMDDGAVVNTAALRKAVEASSKVKKTFQPPWGLTKRQFGLLVAGIVFLCIALIGAIILGVIFGTKVYQPNYPAASPWWKRSQMYQLNIATWANDVDGPIGRFQDVLPRMAYLASEIGATSVVLTNLVACDVNGVTSWQEVDQAVDATGEAFSVTIPKLVATAKQPLGVDKSSNPIHLLLGLPLYATSLQHEWFQQSRSTVSSRFANFYQWRANAPTTEQERRYFAYDSVRRAYYHHTLGNPNSPYLNLTNTDVQNEMKKVLQFWKARLALKGIMVTNSTNVLDQMMQPLRTILDSETQDNEMIWFADDPATDAVLNVGNKVCYYNIRIKQRVPTRTNDLNAQVVQAMNDTRTSTCSPIWTVTQLTEDNKDFLSVQQLASFLPGSYLMKAGQEVDLTTGLDNLLHWEYLTYLSNTTYWPVNVQLRDKGKLRHQEWRRYIRAVKDTTLLATDINSNTLTIHRPTGTENLLAMQRTYKPTDGRVYFVVSFQTLNTQVPLNAVLTDVGRAAVTVTYDSRHVYSGRLTLGDVLMVNNQVLLLHYF